MFLLLKSWGSEKEHQVVRPPKRTKGKADPASDISGKKPHHSLKGVGINPDAQFGETTAASIKRDLECCRGQTLKGNSDV